MSRSASCDRAWSLAWFLHLPVSLVVFGVRQGDPDVDEPEVVANAGHELALVAADVEDCEHLPACRPDAIGVRVSLLSILQAVPLGTGHGHVPTAKCLLRVCVALPDAAIRPVRPIQAPKAARAE